MHLVFASWIALSGAAIAQPSQGACFALDVRAGEPFSLSGRVQSFPRQGALSIVDAEGATHAIYGLGPRWFWQDAGVARPRAGDTVAIEGRMLDCGVGREKVALSVTVEGETVRLRDPTNGLPIWARRAP